MKKFLFFLIISISIGEAILTSCNTRGKPTPEEEVRNYGKYFVEKLNANQLDSLAVSYPDIAKADSIIPITSDTIIVAENAPGQFDMTLADGITLKVTRSEDGNISVIESKGLFAFPADKVDIAKKTGMITEETNDIQKSEVLKNEDFFNWLDKHIFDQLQNAVVIEEGVSRVKEEKVYNELYDGVVTFMTTIKPIIITNNGNVPIEGADYTVYYTYEIEREEAPEGTFTRSKKGISLNPGESGQIVITTDGSPFSPPVVKNPRIKWNKSDNINKNNYKFSGKEYQEYLDSKK